MTLRAPPQERVTIDPIMLVALLIWSGAVSKFAPIGGVASVVLACVLITSISASRRFQPRALLTSLSYCAPLIVLATISGIWADDPANWIGKLLSFLLLLVTAASYSQSRPDALGSLVQTLMIYGLVHSGLSLVLIYSGSPLGRASATHLVGILTHKTALTNMSALCAVASVWCLMWGKRSLIIPSLLSLGLSVWILLIGGGGQAVLGTAIASAAMVTKRHISSRLSGIIYLAVGLTMVVLPFFDQLPDLFSVLTGKDTNLTGRLQFWQFGREMIADRPILGYGFSNIGYTAGWSSFQLASLYDEYGAVVVAPNMHNQWIELAYMLGYTGLAIGLYTFVFLPLRLFAQKTDTSVQAVGLCTLLVTFSGFNSNLILNAPEPFIFFCAVFCAGGGRAISYGVRALRTQLAVSTHSASFPS